MTEARTDRRAASSAPSPRVRTAGEVTAPTAIGAPRRAAPARPGGGRSQLIDLMRGASAQLVVLGHVTALMCGWSEPSQLLHRVIRNVVAYSGTFAHEAVMVFFVISGYLVGGAVLGGVARNSFRPGTYAIDRLSRLWVVLLPGLVLGAILDAISFATPRGLGLVVARPEFFHGDLSIAARNGVDTFFCNLFFLQNVLCKQYGTNLSLWSLGYEFAYYILFPCLVTALWPSTPWRARIAAALGFAATAALIGSHWVWRDYAFYSLIWALGALVAFVSARRSRAPLAWDAAALLVAGGGLLLNHTILELKIGDVGAGLFAAGLLLARERLDGWLRRCGRAAKRVMEFASDYSFSLFLIHLPVAFTILTFAPKRLRRIEAYTPEDFVAVAGVVLAINLAAIVFYFLFERHYHVVRKAVSSALARRRGAVESH